MASFIPLGHQRELRGLEIRCHLPCAGGGLTEGSIQKRRVSLNMAFTSVQTCPPHPCSCCRTQFKYSHLPVVLLHPPKVSSRPLPLNNFTPAGALPGTAHGGERDVTASL